MDKLAGCYCKFLACTFGRLLTSLVRYLSPKTRSFTSSPLAISTERTFSSIDSGMLSTKCFISHLSFAASCVLVDLRQVLHRVSLDYISPIDQKELIVKSFLSIFLTRGLDDSIDNIIKERLGIIKSRSEFGFTWFVAPFHALKYQFITFF